MTSIRQRLLFWQIAALLLTGILVSLLTYSLAWKGFNRVRDYSLQQIAYSVVRHGLEPLPEALAPGAAPAQPSAPAPAESEDLGQFVSQIWLPDGQLVYSSLDRVGPPLQVPGFHVVNWGGEQWHVHTLADGGQLVQVAVTSSDQASSFAEMVPWLTVPLMLLVVGLGLLIHVAVTRALVPLERFRHDIGRRDAQALHPVDERGLPDELRPLAHALNQLLARVEALLSGQRRFVADAAHELNTPLAAVKLQAQLARRAGEGQRMAALDELDRGIERTTHLVSQLLQMARLEPDMAERHPQALALGPLAAQVVAAFSAQADARGIDLGLDARGGDLQVLADPAELRVLLDNLVDNALRHTPAGSRVDVRVERGTGVATLSVIDNGAGIAADDRDRVLERFVRLNPQNTPGSGLGLAIVRHIAERHHAGLSLGDSPGGGLTVRVDLPLAHPAETPSASLT